MLPNASSVSKRLAYKLQNSDPISSDAIETSALFEQVPRELLRVSIPQMTAVCYRTKYV